MTDKKTKDMKEDLARFSLRSDSLKICHLLSVHYRSAFTAASIRSRPFVMLSMDVA